MSGKCRTSARLVFAVACVLLVVIAGCVSADEGDVDADSAPDDGATEEGDSIEPETLGSSIGTSTDGGADLVFHVTSLSLTNNEFMALEFTIQNNSGETLPFHTALAGTHGSATPSAVTLIDPENNQKYFPQQYQNETCYCSNWDDQSSLQPDASIEAWVIYPEPQSDVDTMIVDIPQAPPILDIPIGGEVDPPSDPDDELADPKVLDLYNFSDNLDDGTSRTDTEEETAIMLSTDVLFDTGESTLTDEAEGVLEEAAIEIDNASGELVQIEGHADDTGTDAINDPLSLERAQAVQERLEDLVNRSEVTYEAEGHGSADPIANNETEDGREKNRRVTVTFAK